MSWGALLRCTAVLFCLALVSSIALTAEQGAGEGDTEREQKQTEEQPVYGETVVVTGTQRVTNWSMILRISRR